ncbi:unnamed protein product [Pedinophyceae sp. YPF-701]|nr:unnamed protein product [Pedinophyceae sp. YPF-701]
MGRPLPATVEGDCSGNGLPHEAAQVRQQLAAHLRTYSNIYDARSLWVFGQRVHPRPDIHVGVPQWDDPPPRTGRFWSIDEAEIHQQGGARGAKLELRLGGVWEGAALVVYNPRGFMRLDSGLGTQQNISALLSEEGPDWGITDADRIAWAGSLATTPASLVRGRVRPPGYVGPAVEIRHEVRDIGLDQIYV